MSRYARSHDDPALQGVDVSLGELDALSTGLQEELKRAIAEETASIQADARRRAPGSGRYRSAILMKLFDEGMTGKVFVIQLPWIRNLKWQRRVNPSGRGLWPKNLPLWLEYGTSKMEGRGHLIPAFEAGVHRLNRAVEGLLQRAGGRA